MDKYFLNLYHKGKFIGKYISINHLLVLSDFPNDLRDQLKKDFTLVPEEYEDIKHGIKILLERPVNAPKGQKRKKKSMDDSVGI